MKRNVHFRKYSDEGPACRVTTLGPPQVTNDRRKVTCERCKVTYKFRRGDR